MKFLSIWNDEMDFHYPVIYPLIERHAQDAAFYWSQVDRCYYSRELGLTHLERFGSLLEAHLTGLVVAKSDGWKAATEALQRWQNNGEAFVCMSLALRGQEQLKIDSMLNFLRKRPEELSRGVIAAVGACSTQKALPIVSKWSTSGTPDVGIVCALRSVELIGKDAVESLANALPTYLASPSPYVRAAACRISPLFDAKESSIQQLCQLLDDREIQVRAEAAIALSALGASSNAILPLKKCVVEQIARRDDAKGWAREQATRRLNRWTRKLASLTPPGSVDLALMSKLPHHSALTFLIFHGDLTHLELIVDYMGDTSAQLYAGWVFETLTGVDLVANNLAKPVANVEAGLSESTFMGADFHANAGLPTPNQMAIKSFLKENNLHLFDGQRTLLGQEHDLRSLLSILETHPQAVRALAANFLNSIQEIAKINTLAPYSQQIKAMQKLEHSL